MRFGFDPLALALLRHALLRAILAEAGTMLAVENGSPLILE